MISFGFAKLARYPSAPRAPHAEEVHRSEDDQCQGSWGFQLAGRRFDPWQHAGDIGGDQKNKERAEQRQERTRILADDVLDLAHDTGHD
jgi:hypothetical protein